MFFFSFLLSFFSLSLAYTTELPSLFIYFIEASTVVEILSRDSHPLFSPTWIHELFDTVVKFFFTKTNFGNENCRCLVELKSFAFNFRSLTP